MYRLHILGGDFINGNHTITPIAYIENGYKEKFGTPRQSGLAKNIISKIVFTPEFRDENCIRDIEQYSHLWLIWGFSGNFGEWSPTVRPPRLGGNKRVGVFATRSPFRPNSLGLTCVKLEAVENTENGKVLCVSGADIINGTPIYDIKPYLPYADSVPDARGGFSEEHKDYKLPVKIAETLCESLTEAEITQIKDLLSLDPRPSYQNDCERIYGFDFSDYKIKFRCDGEKIIVTEISK